MWYALYCPDKKAQDLLHACRAQMQEDILRDVFLFSCERMRRYEGAWHTEKVNMFPNYIFLESDHKQKLLEAFEYILKNPTVYFF